MIFGTFGTVKNPFDTLTPTVSNYTSGSTGGEGLFFLLNNLIKLVIVSGSIYAFWNLITAGFVFLNAGGDSKKITQAWDKIWQSLVGLILVVGSFTLAIVMGYIIYGPDNALLLVQPKLFTP